MLVRKGEFEIKRESEDRDTTNESVCESFAKRFNPEREHSALENLTNRLMSETEFRCYKLAAGKCYHSESR